MLLLYLGKTITIVCPMNILHTCFANIISLPIKNSTFFYFQNTFHFVSMSRQTDNIGKKYPKNFMEQTVEDLTYQRKNGIYWFCNYVMVSHIWKSLGLWASSKSSLFDRCFESNTIHQMYLFCYKEYYDIHQVCLFCCK